MAKDAKQRIRRDRSLKKTIKETRLVGPGLQSSPGSRRLFQHANIYHFPPRFGPSASPKSREIVDVLNTPSAIRHITNESRSQIEIKPCDKSDLPNQFADHQREADERRNR